MDSSELIERLMLSLRHCDFAQPVAQRMTYMTVPWVTDATFEGFPIQTLMSPPVTGSPKEIESIFDGWCYPLLEGVGSPEAALKSMGHGALALFVNRNSADFKEAAVVLLYALSKAEGATLAYTRKEIWVTHGDVRYGIDADGHVRSRFCTGLDLGAVAPKHTLESVKEVRTFDSTFIRLYREAYGLGSEHLSALIALRTGDPDFNFAKAFRQHMPRRVPGNGTLRVIETLVIDAKDPVAKLYTQLVPLWMNPTEFLRTFGALKTRNTNPSFTARQKYVSSMYDFFHKNKNKDLK